MLSPFFIHGHELLIAVHQGHRAEKLHPIPALRLSTAKEITEIKGREKTGAWPNAILSLTGSAHAIKHTV